MCSYRTMYRLQSEATEKPRILLNKLQQIERHPGQTHNRDFVVKELITWT